MTEREQLLADLAGLSTWIEKASDPEHLRTVLVDLEARVRDLPDDGSVIIRKVIGTPSPAVAAEWASLKKACFDKGLRVL
jgi:hypothetical protein